MNAEEHTVRIGAASMRALRDFLSNPTGSLRLNGRIAFEATTGGGVLVRTAPEPVNVNVSQHGEDLTAAYLPQEPAD